MNSKEKIEYMLNLIREKAKISPPGPFYIRINPLLDIGNNRGIPDEAPIVFSISDQISILEKFEKDGLLFGVNLDEDYKGGWIILGSLDINGDDNPYNKTEVEGIDEVGSGKGKPFTSIKGGEGYFQFYKQGEKILIGKEDTRHFRLLRALSEPHFGVQKNIEALFEAIKTTKDKNDSSLSDYSSQRDSRILEIITNTKKELQKNKKLQGKLKYRSDNKKRTMWLELEG